MKRIADKLQLNCAIKMPPPVSKTPARNKSGTQTRSATASAGVGSMASIEDYFIPAKPIDEDLFKKAHTDRKLDMMAAALNTLCDSFNDKIDTLKQDVNSKLDAKIDTLESKIDAKLQPLWEKVFDEEDGLNAKTGKLMETVFSPESGLKDKVIQLEKAAVDMNTSFTELAKEVDQLKSHQDILKGYVGKHANHISTLQDKVVEITAKSMEKNISISGIPETTNENCMEVAKTFLRDELRLESIEENELFQIKDSFRIGFSQPSKPRLLILKCNLFLKRKILEAAKEYKDRLEGAKPKFYINSQVPDKMAEQNRLVRHLIWEQRKKEEGLPYEQKARITVQNDMVYICE